MRKSVPLELTVHFAFDEEANVWYIARSDIPGLRVEAENPQQLLERVQACAVDLIQLNEAEILKNHAPKPERAVTVKPVFDSPLQLAFA